MTAKTTWLFGTQNSSKGPSLVPMQSVDKRDDKERQNAMMARDRLTCLKSKSIPSRASERTQTCLSSKSIPIRANDDADLLDHPAVYKLFSLSSPGRPHRLRADRTLERAQSRLSMMRSRSRSGEQQHTVNTLLATHTVKTERPRSVATVLSVSCQRRRMDRTSWALATVK
ncbi:uncharacterized protein L969DRAFT_48668 [Mixia osmundae IAM 14324]|uniref:Uncharacterized protein n=1 Tax=Mixia osmundae (strain CBS 9802 / IAM 14324 / JCM 22182 / KY 12970) TaxID=764103 RepID=G7DVT3_MIXOS|nr:uncharacterized protein L969DRAFT_48668 [Mixia osmundae IAM 14324]KEI39626.1 hypothetical protein L969DRAFT_48668 [Mixia osmundae IAM 14324]GAA94693.1 hypothetical protein E5Q_01346 [Mixia osmundae IAM 14324]